MSLVIQIHRCSAFAARLLQQQEIVGWVHSRYARLINIRTPSGRLLTLQGPGLLQAPGALALATAVERSIPPLPVGALVVQQHQGVKSVPAALQLVGTHATVWDGRIQPVLGLDASCLALRAAALAAWIVHHAPTRGLAPLLVLTPHTHHTLSAVCARVYAALLPLCTSRVLTPRVIVDTAFQVVGLGDGLTPAGDDLLVGLLAVFHAAAPLQQHLPARERQRFLRHIQTSTSDLSGEFLRCAVAGDFAEPVALLIRSCFTLAPTAWQQCAAALAAVGQSSGIDAMVGMVLGGRLLARTLVPGNV
jgi:hypothetical protein